MLPLPAPLNELNQALMDTTLYPVISPFIYNMFLRRGDPAHFLQQFPIVMNRFYDARRLYQTVMYCRSPQAIFYRLADKSTVEAAFQTARRTIREEFKDMVTRLGTAPSAAQVDQFFTDIVIVLQGINPRNFDQEVRLLAANFLSIAPNRVDLETADPGNIDNWFGAQKVATRAVAENAFYGVVDTPTARNVGMIYNPTDHNWGVNTAWALAVARTGAQIFLISELHMRHLFRTHAHPLFPNTPSAFCLEIAIAVKMGYGLNIVNNTVSLMSPGVLNDHRSTGIPGNGPIPTTNEQLDIFRQCVRARELHTMLPLNAGADLRTHVHNICTTGAAADQLDFVEALNLLQKGGSAVPIMAALQLREYRELKALLGANPFSADAAYDQLRIAANTALLTANSQHLTNLSQANDGADLRQHVHTVCPGGDVGAKDELAKTLEAMRVAGTLNNILAVLELREHRELRVMLAANLFNVEAYNQLRTEARNVQLNAIGNDLAAKDPEALSQHIENTLTSHDANIKSDLADALEVRRAAGTLVPLLQTLGIFYLGGLSRFLNAPPLEGNAQYNDLRGVVHQYQQRLIQAAAEVDVEQKEVQAEKAVEEEVDVDVEIEKESEENNGEGNSGDERSNDEVKGEPHKKLKLGP